MTYTPSKQYEWISQYRRSHTVIIFIILMNEKSVSISVYIENKTTKIRLSPCVHITFCSHLFLFMNVNFIRHWWMLSHLCRMRVLWFSLNVAIKYLHDIAMRAMFVVLKKSRSINLDIDIQLELFDLVVFPIMLYGCEVWGFLILVFLRGRLPPFNGLSPIAPKRKRKKRASK